LHSVWTADTPAGRALLDGNESRATFVESFVLVKTPQGWKMTFGHTSKLPADAGFDVGGRQEHGGVKITEVTKGGPAERAGIKSGDVLIAYGGQKIDNPIDLDRLKYVHDEGEKVTVIVTRGPKRVTEELTLEAMKLAP
jgi:S1-C subfamily serine protease